MATRAGLDRRAVVLAAAEIVDTQGLEQLTMGQLASKLNVRTPSLYNHVNGLADLQHELALVGVRDLLGRFSRAAIGKSGAEAIIALANAYRAYAKEHPGLYALTQQAPDTGDTAMIALSQEVLDNTLAVLDAYQLSEEEALHAVRALRSLVHGFVSLEMNGGFGMALSLDESYRYLIENFIRGLAQRTR